MLSHNKKKVLARAALGVLSLSLLAACASFDPFGGSNRSATGANGTVARMPSDLENAICQGMAEDAVAVMTSEPLASNADRFFLALATEEAGHPARARALYARLMQSGSADRVRVRCGRRTLADGTVSDEAAKRLAAVARDLAVLDANLRPQRPLHQGLPPAMPVASTGGTASVPVGPRRAVDRPGSQSPFGQWFVHLASYRSIEAATNNRATIERQFPALAGIIDQWEVDVGGMAVRLGVRLNDKAEANRVCGAVKSQGSYCAVLDTSS